VHLRISMRLQLVAEWNRALKRYVMNDAAMQEYLSAEAESRCELRGALTVSRALSPDAWY
jgi:hypothetical protein